MKHSAGTRILSTILALLLMGGCLPLTALAAEAEVQPPAGLSSEEADTSGVPEVSPGEPQETDPPAGDSALPLAGEENLALGQPVTVSGTAEDSSGAELVDGNTAVGEKGWITEDMKNGTTPGQAQTPVWAVIDLGAEASTVSSIVIQWRNNKVWATNYVIQTAATNGEDTQWTTVAEVDRDAADRNGTLAQGEGQTIADEAAYRDTITLTSVPALTNATLQRYVRFCFTRVNDLAPGNNLNVAEIQIMGFSAPAEPDDEKPAAPTNLTAAPASDSAVLTWTEATDNAAVALYQIYLGDAADPTATTTETTYTLTGLEPEMEYTVKVTAVDTSLNESDAASVTFTTEAAPVIDWDVEFSEDFEDGIDSGLWADKYGNAQTASAPAEPKGLSFDAGQEQTALVWSSEDLLNGIISVWYYDTMEITSGVRLHVAFVESADAPGKMAGIGVNTRQNANYYLMRYPGAGNYSRTNVQRTEGWHEFRWDCSDGESMKMYIDGQLINTATDITSFSKLTFGDDWTNPAGVAPGYYDDISIQGKVYVPPVDAASELEKITALPAPGVDDTKLALPEVAAGYTVSFAGSELEQVVSKDGTILGTNVGERTVQMIVKVTSESDPEDTARKNLSVTIPDHSGSAVYEGTGWFERSGSNPVPGIVPSVQEWYGYDGAFTLSGSSRIVLNDAAGVGLDKVADYMVADVEEISGINLTVVNGTAADANSDDIYIESQTEDIYQTGEEGYLLVTDESGLRIYSSTYTGCLYGTISAEQMLWLAEDHVSIPMGVIRDFPAYEVRGLYLDVARTPYRLNLLEDYSKILLWYKMNEFHVHLADNRSVKDGTANSHPEDYEGFHRLESREFPSLGAEIRKSGLGPDLTAYDYYEDIYGVPFYTQEEWIQFQKDSKELGVQIISELDMPGHSLVYIRYAQENPDKIDWLTGEDGQGVDISNPTEKELLALSGPGAETARKFAATLWDEYTRTTDPETGEPVEPVFLGDVVHIGCDEYWDNTTANNEGFKTFMETMRQTVMANGKTKVRVWASFNRMKLDDEFLAPLAPYYQIDMWSSGNDDPVKRVEQGFQIINDEDVFMYGNPARERRDIVNAEYIYNSWDPTVFSSATLLKGEPNLLGGTTCLWGDESSEGIIELDLHQRIMRAIPVTSEKCWGSDTEDTFQEFELRANELAEGPGTGIAMEVETQSSLVVDYDFQNVSADGKTVYDASGNGYDAALTGGSAQDGALTFDGSTLVETPLGSVGYPFTVSFDLTLTQTDIDASAAVYGDGDATNDANLLSGYDGRLQAVGYNGHVSADVNYFIRDLGYQIPADQKVNITLVGTMHGMKLYVDGVLQTFLSIKNEGASYPPRYMSSIYSSFVLPLEKIGENFHGSLFRVKVYDKALSAEEVAAEAGLQDGDSLVNVAQNSSATSYQVPGRDQANNRLYYAAKAVDGDGFDSVNTAVSGDRNKNSEIHSCWYGFQDDSYLLLDLGQERIVSQFDIQWKGSNYASQYRIELSRDGETWDTVYTADSADRDSSTGVSHVTLNSPASARYVKLQGIKRAGSQYTVQEFLVYEDVDKSELEALLAVAEEAAAERGLSFESTGSDRTAFDALVFARAMVNSPIATWEDVNRAIDGLSRMDEVMVTFDSQGGSAVAAIHAKLGSTILRPENPVRAGYTFGGWYREPTCTAPWDFDHDVVEADLTLYAMWTANGSSSAPVWYTITVDATANGSVRSSVSRAVQGTSVTLEVTPDEGYALEQLTVTDGNGNSVTLTASGDDRYVFIMPRSDVTVAAVFAAEIDEDKTPLGDSPFTDVGKDDWFYDAVEYVYRNGMMQGTSNTLFSPAMTTTRGMIVTILYRLENEPAVTDAADFNDVSAGRWYSDAVAWASANGIVGGYGNGSFGPEDTITREQTAAILYRYAQYKAYNVTASGKLGDFADAGKISSWAERAMSWAVGAGLLNGKNRNLLDPTGTTTRAEAAMILTRFCQNFVK